MACLIDSPGVGRRPIHQGIERVYLRLFLPQSTSPWVYIFTIKQFELRSQTRDQSDHLRESNPRFPSGLTLAHI